MTQLQQVATDVWTAEGPVVSFFGLPFPTRMVVVRCEQGLWVWSPIELTPELEAAIDEIGVVCWVATPNKLHHLFVAPWLAAYRDSIAYAPPGLAPKRTDITFRATLGDERIAEWGDELAHVVVRGSIVDEVLYLHRPSRTCIVGDLIIRQDPSTMNRLQRGFTAANNMLGPNGSTPREWRATFLARGQARDALRTALGWEPQRVIIAHGACELQDGAAMLERSLSWITKPWPM